MEGDADGLINIYSTIVSKITVDWLGLLLQASTAVESHVPRFSTQVCFPHRLVTSQRERTDMIEFAMCYLGAFCNTTLRRKYTENVPSHFALHRRPSRWKA
jgi:hypothetical protein